MKNTIEYSPVGIALIIVAAMNAYGLGLLFMNGGTFIEFISSIICTVIFTLLAIAVIVVVNLQKGFY